MKGSKPNGMAIWSILLMMGCVVLGTIAAVEGRTTTVVAMAVLLVANIITMVAQMKMEKKSETKPDDLDLENPKNEQ